MSTSKKRTMTQQMMQRGVTDFDAKIAQDIGMGQGLHFAPVDRAAGVHHVVLTGATGFLGAHVARALLAYDHLRVTCLVRAEDDSAARGRVLSMLASINGALSDPTKLNVIAHDLTSPIDDTPNLMARVADAEVIINCAARVNFTDRYSQARAANVMSVRHLLDLASTGMRLHHVSSVAVFAPDTFAGAQIREDMAPQIASFSSAHGYCQSKLAAELMIRSAVADGLDATVYRPGLIGWDTQSGYYNQSDFLTHFIGASLRLGMLPDIDIGLSVAPVDYVADAIVSTVMHDGPTPPFLHLVGQAPMSIRDLAARITQAGYAVDLCDYETWLNQIDDDRESPLRPLSLLLPSQFPTNGATHQPSLLDGMSAQTGTVLSDAATRAALTRQQVTLPQNNHLNIARFLRRLQS